jgi:predicted MPP superfamily phosphohydrolase
MDQVILVYNLLILSLAFGALLLLSRMKPRRPVVAVAFLGSMFAILSFCGAFSSPVEGFGKIQLLAWVAFVHYPLFLIGVAAVYSHRERTLSYVCIAFVVGLLLIGLDAFLIEPRWLEVSHVTIPTHKLKTPIRVAVIAGLQTDAPGRYEAHAFDLVAAEQPDLILFAGDYLHISESAAYASAKDDLDALMRRSDLKAPLGIYAVKGNVDWANWPELFAGLPVTTFETTSSLDLGPVVLTGLTLADSSNVALSVAPQPKFHIVLGHVPNFSLGQVDADLLIAGHTHGGQVQLPLLGPIFTLSSVPGSWASGMTSIACPGENPGRLARYRHGARQRAQNAVPVPAGVGDSRLGAIQVVSCHILS